jgi:hypothetical protein
MRGFIMLFEIFAVFDFGSAEITPAGILARRPYTIINAAAIAQNVTNNIRALDPLWKIRFLQS